jgi:hypothetical protein
MKKPIIQGLKIRIDEIPAIIARTFYVFLQKPEAELEIR